MTARVVQAIRHLLRVGPAPDGPAPDDTPFVHEMHHHAQQSIRRRQDRREKQQDNVLELEYLRRRLGSAVDGR